MFILSLNVHPGNTLVCLKPIMLATVNVDNFALYIFSRNSSFLNIRENMYTLKISLKSQLYVKREF